MITDITNYEGEAPDLWLIDYDGTLEEGPVLKSAAIEALEIITDNAEAVIISARPDINLYHILKESEMFYNNRTKIHLSGFNGNKSYFKGGRIQDNRLEWQGAEILVELAKKNDIEGLFYTESNVECLNANSEWFSKYFEWTGYKRHDGLGKESRYYMMEFKVDEKSKGIIDRIERRIESWGDTSSLIFTPPFPNMKEAQWMQINPGNLYRDVKAEAAGKYVRVADAKNAVAIGDGLNDKGMVTLENVTGIAMGGSDLAKEISKRNMKKTIYETKNVNEHGLLHAVKHMYGL